MLLRSALALLSLVVVGAAAPPSPNALRHLEQNGYQYIEDLSGHWTTYISCFKVKIQDDNDDDAEGNSYFYNGKYHAQYQTYAAFHLCSNNECDECDKSTGYVTDLADYLETKVEFAQDYCNACQNQCRRRRHLEEEEEEEDDGNDGDAVADCNTCKSECSGLWNPGNNYDEANYLDCQQGQYGDEIQYYQAPTCDDGKIVMGLFYDEDCTVASKADLEVAFNYDTFTAVETMCTSCDGNDDVCADLYQDASHCYGTSEMQGDGGNQVCKKYEQAVREVTYARRKRKYHIRGVVIAVAVLLVVGIFLTHTYFIRHRNKDVNDKSIPLSKFDHGASVHEPQTSSPQVTMT